MDWSARDGGWIDPIHYGGVGESRPVYILSRLLKNKLRSCYEQSLGYCDRSRGCRDLFCWPGTLRVDVVAEPINLIDLDRSVGALLIDRLVKITLLVRALNISLVIYAFYHCAFCNIRLIVYKSLRLHANLALLWHFAYFYYPSAPFFLHRMISWISKVCPPCLHHCSIWYKRDHTTTCHQTFHQAQDTSTTCFTKHHIQSTKWRTPYHTCTRRLP